MEKLSQNCAQLFLRNKYTVFTMGGTVALRFPIPTFYDLRATDLQLPLSEHQSEYYIIVWRSCTLQFNVNNIFKQKCYIQE